MHNIKKNIFFLKITCQDPTGTLDFSTIMANVIGYKEFKKKFNKNIYKHL